MFAQSTIMDLAANINSLFLIGKKLRSLQEHQYLLNSSVEHRKMYDYTEEILDKINHVQNDIKNHKLSMEDAKAKIINLQYVYLKHMKTCIEMYIDSIEENLC